MAASDYARGSHQDSDQDWYHGELSRAEAEQALRAYRHDCFLVRESKGSLVLSLLYKRKLCHIKIEYGPGWYKLDAELVTQSFKELSVLLSYYKRHIISDRLNVTLGEICSKKVSSNRDKMYELTRTEAEQMLAANGRNCFLIRRSGKSLILSLINSGQFYHVSVKHGPGWCRIRGNSNSEPTFAELDTLVSYYQCHCLSEDIQVMLGEPCGSSNRTSQVICHQNSPYSKGEPAELSEHVWYRGNVSEEQATKELKAMKEDAFLVRQDGSSLILSTIVAQSVNHKKIHHTPDGYRLEGTEKVFHTIPELVADCKELPANEEGMDNELERTLPDDPTRYKWYHGILTEEEAHIILRDHIPKNCFLVRPSDNDLILSYQLNGWIYHEAIVNDNQSYKLDRKEKSFGTLVELLQHYQKFPIKDGRPQVLGSACDRNVSDEILKLHVVNKDKWKIKFEQEMDTLKISWRQCADMPNPVSVPQVAVIGKNVYVGGGMTGSTARNILKYNLDEDTWTSLPPCPTYQHSLATLDDRLIAIGGKVGIEVTSFVYTLSSSKWKRKLPPMPTPRCNHSSITHDNRVIIAAGGLTQMKEKFRTDVVEIYIKDQQWYATKRLLFPLSSFSMKIIDNTCYITGGAGSAEESSTTMHSSISSLLEHTEPAEAYYATLQHSITWDKLRGRHPLIYTITAEVDGKLATMGGSPDLAVHCGTQFICLYDFVTHTWVECKGAELPVPLYRSTVVDLGNKKLICVGGQPKSQHFSAQVFVGCYNIHHYDSVQ